MVLVEGGGGRAVGEEERKILLKETSGRWEKERWDERGMEEESLGKM